MQRSLGILCRLHSRPSCRSFCRSLPQENEKQSQQFVPNKRGEQIASVFVLCNISQHIQDAAKTACLAVNSLLLFVTAEVLLSRSLQSRFACVMQALYAAIFIFILFNWYYVSVFLFSPSLCRYLRSLSVSLCAVQYSMSTRCLIFFAAAAPASGPKTNFPLVGRTKEC